MMKYEKVYNEEFDYYYPSELGSGVAIPLTPCIELLNANSNRIADLEAALLSLADGTWWDGNEPKTVSRVESYVKAVLLPEVTK
jgi:hypothetical protein